MKKAVLLLRRRAAVLLPRRLRIRPDAGRGMEPSMDAPDELAPERIDVATGRLLDRRRPRRRPGRAAR